ncbi:MAG: hypothetical protein HY925_13565, partial [Elusimicrobia bacterium]|nr:hypothetical protein [Elusimicrobiota bacterium]
DDQGHKLLKFSAAAANGGDGPFELRAVVQPDGTTSAYQRIYDSDGTFTERFVGQFQFSGHAGHNHFHYAEFASYYVRGVTAGGGVGGIIAASPKIGFAMWDVTSYDLRLPNAPGEPVYNRPDGPTRPPQGISVGWADIYAWNLDEQWIDVTGLPDGDYWLENLMDPQNRLTEKTHGNNDTLLKFRMIRDNIAFFGEPQGGPPPALPVASNDFRTFPNPWRGDANKGLPLKFVPLADGSVVRIFTSTGRFVREVTSLGGQANWNLKDEEGSAVSSGFYYYTVEIPGAGSRKGTFAVIK